jgi:hypothetical protein
MLQAGPSSRMAPSFVAQLNACMVAKLAGSTNENEQRVIEWRQRGLTDLSAGMVLIVNIKVSISK